MIGVVIPVRLRDEQDSKNFIRTLNSLVQQTEQHFLTIICEDHNSQIPIKKIIEKFKDNLTIVHLTKPTSSPIGAGAARNMGIQWANQHRVEGIIFLDADDILLPHAVDALKYEFNHQLADAIFNKNIVEIDHLYHSAEKHTGIWVTGNIYRTSFLIQNNIFFPENFLTNEDVTFSLIVKEMSKKIFYIDTPVYLVCTNEQSTTSVSDTKKRVVSIDYINAIRVTFDYYIKKQIDIEPLLDNIYLCYNYSQQALILKITTIEELQELLIPMIQYVKSKNYLTKTEILKSRNLFKQYFDFDKQYIFILLLSISGLDN